MKTKLKWLPISWTAQWQYMTNLGTYLTITYEYSGALFNHTATTYVWIFSVHNVRENCHFQATYSDYSIKNAELMYGILDKAKFTQVFNTSYLTDSYISFTLNLESGQNFCSNRSIRSSTCGKENISDFPPCGKVVIFVIEFLIFLKTSK